jgi:hypothetical protein
MSRSYLAPVLSFVIIILAAGSGNAQSRPSPFHSGQSIYIVAFRTYPFPYFLNEAPACPACPPRDDINYDLDAERKVRKRIEEWGFFKIAEKPSDADFIFLVRLDGSSMEGLAIPLDAYRQHFKERLDLDALRDAAFGRYVIGPLKLPTLTRLSDRLVKVFREKVTKASP